MQDMRLGCAEKAPPGCRTPEFLSKIPYCTPATPKPLLDTYKEGVWKFPESNWDELFNLTGMSLAKE